MGQGGTLGGIQWGAGSIGFISCIGHLGGFAGPYVIMGETIARIEVHRTYSPGTGALAGTAPPNDWSAR